MAKRFSASLAIAVAALAGCQQQLQSRTAPVGQALPPPNFNGPVLLGKPVVAQATPAPLPRVPPPQPQARAAADVVPAGWTPPVQARPWRWIVIHHSATPFGNAQIMGAWHQAKGWDELGYHFVVDNGNGGPDGNVEVGPRWPKQKWGAHAKTPDNRFNDYGIGICVVGNFDVDHPSAAQLRSLSRLVAYLMKTYRIPPERIVGHGDTKATDCPGRNMPLADVRRTAVKILGEQGQRSTDWARVAVDDDASSAEKGLAVKLDLEADPSMPLGRFHPSQRTEMVSGNTPGIVIPADAADTAGPVSDQAGAAPAADVMGSAAAPAVAASDSAGPAK